MKDNDKIRKLLKIYKDTNRTIHIKTFDDRFYNGTILEINSKKQFVLFTDNKLGAMPILFEEIQVVEPFKEVEG